MSLKAGPLSQELSRHFLPSWETTSGEHLPYRFLPRKGGVRERLKSQDHSKNLGVTPSLFSRDTPTPVPLMGGAFLFTLLPMFINKTCLQPKDKTKQKSRPRQIHLNNFDKETREIKTQLSHKCFWEKSIYMCKNRKPSQMCHNSQKSTQWITDLIGKNKVIKIFKGYKEENLPNFSLEVSF